MSDRMAAEISIGGLIPDSLIADLCNAIGRQRIFWLPAEKTTACWFFTTSRLATANSMIWKAFCGTRGFRIREEATGYTSTIREW